MSPTTSAAAQESVAIRRAGTLPGGQRLTHADVLSRRARDRLDRQGGNAACIAVRLVRMTPSRPASREKSCVATASCPIMASNTNKTLAGLQRRLISFEARSSAARRWRPASGVEDDRVAARLGATAGPPQMSAGCLPARHKTHCALSPRRRAGRWRGAVHVRRQPARARRAALFPASAPACPRWGLALPCRPPP